MLANMVCSLIKHKRIQTTLAKAKAVRSLAEKMVTLGKSGSIHDRRLAAARLHQEEAVRILFNEIAPTQKERNGGYTRIIRGSKKGYSQRQGDAAELAFLEWVDVGVAESEAPKAEKEDKKAEGGEKKAKKGKKADKAGKPAEEEKAKAK